MSNQAEKRVRGRNKMQQKPLAQLIADEQMAFRLQQDAKMRLERHKLSYPLVEKLNCHDGKLGGEIFRLKILWFMKCGYDLHITSKAIQLVRNEYTVIKPHEGRTVIPKRVIQLQQAGWLIGAEAEAYFARYAEQASYIDATTRNKVTLDYCIVSEHTDDGIIHRLKVVRS